MSRAQKLYQLQNIDSQLDEAKRNLTRIAANLGRSKALQEAEAEFETAEQAHRQAQAKMTDLDLELKSLTNKIASQEKNLYSGKPLSAKEAANLQDEVASLKKWQAKREESLLEAMVEVEEKEAELEAAREKLEAVTAKWEEEQRKLRQVEGMLQVKVAQLQEQRPQQVEVITQSDLAEYEHLRAKKGGKAVAAVKSGMCQGCNVSVSQNKVRQARSDSKLMYCGMCGRILHVF